MKKVLTIMLAALLVLGMVACSPEAMGGKGTVTLKVAQPYGAKGATDATVEWGASTVEYGTWSSELTGWTVSHKLHSSSSWTTEDSSFDGTIDSYNIGDVIDIKVSNAKDFGEDPATVAIAAGLFSGVKESVTVGIGTAITVNPALDTDVAFAEEAKGTLTISNLTYTLSAGQKAWLEAHSSDAKPVTKIKCFIYLKDSDGNNPLGTGEAITDEPICATISNGVATFTTPITVNDIPVDYTNQKPYTFSISTCGTDDDESADTDETTSPMFKITASAMPSVYVLNGLTTTLASIDIKSERVVPGSVTLTVGPKPDTSAYDTDPNPYPFGFEAVGNGTNKITLSLVGSVDGITMQSSTDAITWADYTFGTEISVTKGNKIYFRAKNNNGSLTYDAENHMQFEAGTGSKFNVFGNVMFLLDPTGKSTEVPDYGFTQLLKNCRLVDASKLLLPATTVGTNAYSWMFNGNDVMVNGPKELPASTVGDNAYDSMFHSCSSLQIAPIIKLTTHTSNEMHNMFYYCTKLKYVNISDITSFVTENSFLDMIDGAGTYWLPGGTGASEGVCPEILLKSTILEAKTTTGYTDKLGTTPPGWTVVNP